MPRRITRITGKNLEVLLFRVRGIKNFGFGWDSCTALRASEKFLEGMTEILEPVAHRFPRLFCGMTGLLATLLKGFSGFLAKILESLADLFSSLLDRIISQTGCPRRQHQH